jgi:hypothetical protein
VSPSSHGCRPPPRRCAHTSRPSDATTDPEPASGGPAPRTGSRRSAGRSQLRIERDLGLDRTRQRGKLGPVGSCDTHPSWDQWLAALERRGDIRAAVPCVLRVQRVGTERTRPTSPYGFRAGMGTGPQLPPPQRSRQHRRAHQAHRSHGVDGISHSRHSPPEQSWRPAQLGAHSGLRGKNGPSIEGVFSVPLRFTIKAAATATVPNGNCPP